MHLLKLDEQMDDMEMKEKYLCFGSVVVV